MLEEGSECVQAELEAIRGETGADILWPPALNYRELNSTGACFSIWAGSLGMLSDGYFFLRAYAPKDPTSAISPEDPCN